MFFAIYVYQDGYSSCNIPKVRDKAEKALNDLKKWILADGVLCKDKSDEGWGLYGKPHSLYYASSSESILYPLFSKEILNLT